MADARDSKSRGGDTVPVRVRPPAPAFASLFNQFRSCGLCGAVVSIGSGSPVLHFEVVMDYDCIFCKIINKEIPSTFLEETPEMIVIKDIAPKAPVHFLIVPKKHIKDIQSLEADDSLLAGKMILMAQQIAKKYFDNKAFRLVVNSGHDAGQRVYHLHFHILAGKQMTDI